jgi:hypothetical protein
MFFLLSESESPRQKTTVRQREKRFSRSRKAAFGLRLHADLAASNRVWDLHPGFSWWLSVDWQPTAEFEPANAQDRSGKAPDGCWHGSNVEIETQTIRASSGCVGCRRSERRQQFLKPATRAARARIVASESLAQLLVSVHDADSALHLRLGREALPTFAGDLEKTDCLG